MNKEQGKEKERRKTAQKSEKLANKYDDFREGKLLLYKEINSKRKQITGIG